MSINSSFSPSSSEDYFFSFGQAAAQAAEQVSAQAAEQVSAQVAEQVSDIPIGLIPMSDFQSIFRIDFKSIAKGAFGEVSYATHLPSESSIAVKKVDGKANPKHPEWGTAEIMREIDLGMFLQSKHICKIYGYSIDEDGFILIFMELINGLEAYDFFATNRKFAQNFPEVTKKMIRDIAEGLAVLHSSGLVHRDLKSSNVMFELGPSGEFIRAVIIDLGFCIKAEEIPIGCKMGSVNYCSPEIIIGQSRLTCQIDIWALGILIYEMLFHKFPYPDLPSRQLCFLIGNLKSSPPLPPYSGDNKDIKDLRTICEKCLQIDPSARITSAQICAELS